MRFSSVVCNRFWSADPIPGSVPWPAKSSWFWLFSGRVGGRVSELAFVVANLGGGLGDAVLIGQFAGGELTVNTGFITRGNPPPICLCFGHSCASASLPGSFVDSTEGRTFEP